MNAHIVQINISTGGVPKRAVASAMVTANGIDGDGHRYSGHGGPQKALCLYGLERLLDLQREGHPIFPGSTGENLTVSGIDWSTLVPGVRLRIGDGVVATITSYTEPCAKIADSFRDGDITRMHQEHHPGWARVYASIERGGPIRPGDAVIVES